MNLSHHDFLIRYAGQSRVFRLPSINELPLSERFFLSLLCEQLDSAANILPQLAVEDDWEHFVRISVLNGFSTLMLERFSRLQRAHHPQATGSSDPLLAQALAVFKRMSASEILQASRFEASFKHLLGLLGPLSQEVVWCKGSVLRYKIYDCPEHRQCNDFDIYVPPSAAESVVTALLNADFQFIKGTPAFCNQLGVGPVASICDLLLTPAPDLVSRAAMTLSHPDQPAIDIKLTPLDRGLRLREEPRFRANCETVELFGSLVKMPDKIDHLILSAINCVKDGLAAWKSLYDVHLLAGSLDDDDWQELVRRCEVEGLSTDLWVCLSQAVEMLSTRVPERPLEALRPQGRLALRKLFHLTSAYEFSWNTNSLPGMLLNAVAADDFERKTRLIVSMFRPGDDFLNAYYGRYLPMWLRVNFACALLHYLTIILPAAAIRRTTWRWLWTASSQYSDLEACKRKATTPTI